MTAPSSRGSLVLATLAGATCGAMVAFSPASDNPVLLACFAAFAAAVAAATFQALWSRRWFKAQVLVPSEHLIAEARRASLGQESARAQVPEDSPLARLAGVFAEAMSGMDGRARASLANYSMIESSFEQIHSVLHSIGVGVIVEDRRTGVVLINPIARQLLGLSAGDKVEGRPIVDLFPTELRPQIHEVIAERWRTNVPATMAAVHLRDRVVDLSLAPVLDAHKREAYGSVMVLLDVTRSHELQSLKDDFLRSVSHELLTPLTSIRSFSEILLEMTPRDEATWREFVGIVNAESDRLMRLVGDVLDLAQLDAGRVALSIQPLAVKEIFRTIASAFEPLASERRIRFEIEVQPGVEGVLADLDRLNQVLNNLVGNAFKFTPDAGQICLKAAPDGEQVRLSVDDSGLGIPKEQHAEVFERFSQVGLTVTDKPMGTGLGLVLCHELLKYMGGRIRLETSALGGSSMICHLPACDRPAREWVMTNNAVSPESEQCRAARHASGSLTIGIAKK